MGTTEPKTPPAPECPRCAATSEREQARAKRWQAANPWRFRELKQRRYAAHRKVAVEKIDPFAVHARDAGKCALCGGTLPLNDPSFSLDYVVSVPKGGGHVFDNVRTAHLLCKVARRSHLPPCGDA